MYVCMWKMWTHSVSPMTYINKYNWGPILPTKKSVIYQRVHLIYWTRNDDSLLLLNSPVLYLLAATSSDCYVQFPFHFHFRFHFLNWTELFYIFWLLLVLNVLISSTVFKLREWQQYFTLPHQWIVLLKSYFFIHFYTKSYFVKVTYFGPDFSISLVNVLFWPFAQLDLPDFGPRSISLQTSSPNVAKDVNKNKDLIVSLYTQLQFCILCSNFVHSAPILYTQPRFCMLSPDFVYSDPIVCTWLH